MLEIKNVWKTFNKGTVNEKQALCGVNLTLNDGDFCTVTVQASQQHSTQLQACGLLTAVRFLLTARIFPHCPSIKERRTSAEFFRTQ